MELYNAVKLAAKQPAEPAKDNSRAGPEYYCFGTSGSAACTTAGHYYHIKPVIGQPCYLAGPEDTKSDLKVDLQSVKANPQSPGLSLSDAKVMTVPPGWIVDEASYPHYGQQPLAATPRPSSTCSTITSRCSATRSPTPSSRPTNGQPDVSFGFTGGGGNAFQNVTGAIAKRGSAGQRPGAASSSSTSRSRWTPSWSRPLHRLQAESDGIPGDNGGDIQGGFTISSAQGLAQQLRLGALPIELEADRQLAGLGHPGRAGPEQGPAGRLIGLIAVMIFLLAYYRVLG